MNKKVVLLSVVLLLSAIFVLPVILRTPKDTKPPSLPESDLSGNSENIALTTSSNRPLKNRDEPVNEAGHQSTTQVKPSVVREKVHQDSVISGDSRYPLRTYKTLSMPNDPQANQWWVDAVKMTEAWGVPRGNHETILAIIDTGFALEHEEFVNRWYVNPAEVGPTNQEAPSQLNCTDRGLPLDKSCNLIDDDDDGIVDNESGPAQYENPSRLNCTDQGRSLDKSCNLIDDSGNGLVDDWRGWDFINHDNSPQAGELNPNGTGTRHGTIVAGVAAATGNNNKGVAGVDWGTKILPLQALDDDSYGHTVSVARSIRYAVSQGADVISLSLGSTLSDPYVREAVLEAIASGSVIVAASGNDGCQCILYPANYPEVVAVGALNTDNNPASFSAWGANLDILAPGVNMYTTDWRSNNPTSAYASGVSGTSLATPLVSGMLTRLLSHQPNASQLQLIAALTENTNRTGISSSSARTNQRGFGILDAQSATLRMTNTYNPVQLYSFSPVSGGNRLNPSESAEKTANIQLHQCEPGKTGGTPIFELTKGSLKFFSASSAERQRAVESGYSAGLLFYSCVQQPHDEPLSIRVLNVFRELKNTSDKTQF